MTTLNYYNLTMSL